MLARWPYHDSAGWRDEWNELLFNDTFGFCVQGVGSKTAILPADWADRLVTVRNGNTLGKIGFCLGSHHLCASKLLAKMNSVTSRSGANHPPDD